MLTLCVAMPGQQLNDVVAAAYLSTRALVILVNTVDHRHIEAGALNAFYSHLDMKKVPNNNVAQLQRRPQSQSSPEELARCSLAELDNS